MKWKNLVMFCGKFIPDKSLNFIIIAINLYSTNTTRFTTVSKGNLGKPISELILF